jgi:hypothetical protein
MPTGPLPNLQEFTFSYCVLVSFVVVVDKLERLLKPSQGEEVVWNRFFTKPANAPCPACPCSIRHELTIPPHARRVRLNVARFGAKVHVRVRCRAMNKDEASSPRAAVRNNDSSRPPPLTFRDDRFSEEPLVEKPQIKCLSPTVDQMPMCQSIPSAKVVRGHQVALGCCFST